MYRNMQKKRTKNIHNITLVTWCGSFNYGTNLQAYALYKSLTRLGYQVRLLHEFDRGDFHWYGRLHKKLRLFVGKLKGKASWIEPKWGKHPLKMKRVHEFEHRFIPMAQEICSQKDWEAHQDQTDCFVVGSDQVWNPYYLNPFFLLTDVRDDIRKIAYASSVGVPALPVDLQDTYVNAWERFDALGLRKLRTTKMIRKLASTPAVTVVDPTLLNERSDWEQLADKAEPIELPSGTVDLQAEYILAYFVGDRVAYKNYLQSMQEKTGIATIYLLPMSKTHMDFKSIEGLQLIETAGPLEFLNLLRHAAWLCTDSYHACIMSLQFEVPLKVLLRFETRDKKSQNNRLLELIDRYQLEENLWDAQENPLEGETVSFQPMSESNRIKLRKAIEADRQVSLNFLIAALGEESASIYDDPSVGLDEGVLI